MYENKGIENVVFKIHSCFILYLKINHISLAPVLETCLGIGFVIYRKAKKLK